MVSLRFTTALTLLAVAQAAAFASHGPPTFSSTKRSSMRMSTATASPPSAQTTEALQVNGGAAPVAPDISLVSTPAATYMALAAKGASNKALSVAKTLTAAIMGGAYVGVGGMVSLAVSGNMPGVAATNPGLVKFAFAALFPVALFLCLQAGAQLFTGNTATMAAAYFEKKVEMKDVLRSWGLAYFGNFVGCAGFAAICKYCGVLGGGAAKMAAGMVASKTAGAFMPTLVKGILCNWLVCMGVFLATQAKDVPGKYIGMFLPISAFVSIGFEHSVANMFILPAGMLCDGGVALSTVLSKNMLPVTIGNVIAGALVVAGGMSWQFGKLGEGK